MTQMLLGWTSSAGKVVFPTLCLCSWCSNMDATKVYCSPSLQVDSNSYSLKHLITDYRCTKTWHTNDYDEFLSINPSFMWSLSWKNIFRVIPTAVRLMWCHQFCGCSVLNQSIEPINTLTRRWRWWRLTSYYSSSSGKCLCTLFYGSSFDSWDI